MHLSFLQRLARRAHRSLVILLACGSASVAMATSVAMLGYIGYSTDNKTFALMNVDQVRNSSASSSAALRLELWATTAPFDGSIASGHRLSVYSLGSLAAGASLYKVASGAVPWAPPTKGWWYVAMVLTEQTGAASNDGFTVVSSMKINQIYSMGPPADTTPPTVSITSPTGGNVAGTVTVSANASDNLGVARVDLLVNGVVKGSDLSAPFQFSWNTTTLANGAAQLKAIAYDTSGNSTSSSIITVNVANVAPPPTDTTPPTVSIASPTGGNVAGTVAISANASDNVGVARVDLLVNGVVKASDTTAPYQFSWNSTTVANGAAQLKAVAYDAAGNSAPSAIVTVNVANVTSDTTPPTVSIASPTGGNVAGTVAISANASDNVGVARVDFLVNGVVKGSDTSAPFQYSWNSTTVANGAAQLKAVAYDAAGNSAPSAIVTVNVANASVTDTTPPTASIASPPNGAHVAGNVAVSVSAGDNVGVARVDLLVNGVVKFSDTTSPFQYVWNSLSVPNGSVQLKAIAYDAAGNSAPSAVATYTVANTVASNQGYAVEYYNASLDHYFISASDTDIAALDSGQFMGWERTGEAFKVYTEPAGSANPVCRFYIPPSVGDSHFYSASPVECAVAVTRFPMFVQESADVFFVNLPDPDSGACGTDMVPVYRVWNGRSDSNHRYTTNILLREEMVAKGYTAEGYGPESVIMCAPM
jgi:hypothetical protein